jgi:hypothetical protein
MDVFSVKQGANKKLLNKKLLALAVACILLVNGFVLGKVYINRSTVVAQLNLSERELQLPYHYGFAKEDSSARVSLRWMTPSSRAVTLELDRWHWQYDRNLQLSQAHFASFGFPACSNSTRLRQKRAAWVLLEFNGRSYEQHLAQIEQYQQLVKGLSAQSHPELVEKEIAEKRKGAAELLTEAQTSHSRLFIVDAAADYALLVQAKNAFPSSSQDQLLIVPAEVRAGYYRCDKPEQRQREIVIDGLAVDSLHIPKHLARKFAGNNTGRNTVKFTAQINYGRLHEPWISDLQ